MREPGSEVIAIGRDKDLGLVLEPPEGFGVNHAVPIPLKRGANRRFRLRDGSEHIRTPSRRRAKLAVLTLLEKNSNRVEVHALPFPRASRGYCIAWAYKRNVRTLNYGFDSLWTGQVSVHRLTVC